MKFILGKPNLICAQGVLRANIVHLHLPPVKNVHLVPILNFMDLRCVLIVQLENSTKFKDKHPAVHVTMFITSTILPPTQKIGTALGARSVPPALDTSIGAVSLPNLDGQDATTTMLPLNVVLFQRLVWVEPTPP